jgi:type I restriction-modification system DNA methylase subunit
MKSKDLKTGIDFQTPQEVARYMASLIPRGVKTVLEPTPGLGNIVNELEGYEVTAPKDFFQLPFKFYDCIVMNPPFAAKYAHLDNAPAELQNAGMAVGYWMLNRCMEMSESIIALMPWFTISDSDVRLRYLKSFGLKSITALPRKTFNYARIQTCVIELNSNWGGRTEFRVYDALDKTLFR